MDKIKLAAAAAALTLAVGGCSNMMGEDSDMGGMPEPAAGPAMESQDEQGMAPGAPGGMLDSDDQEGAGSDDAPSGTPR